MTAMFVYVTAASEDEALRLARAAVGERLAACANIIPGMRSLYWWQGKIDEGRETVLVLKTEARHVAKLTRRVKALHSYSVPCVVALPIKGGNRTFLDWIKAETAPTPKRKKRA
jgi:periplasmic divalent cation tolerance protein